MGQQFLPEGSVSRCSVVLILLFFDEIIFEGIVVDVAWGGIVLDDDEDGCCVEQPQYEQDDVEDGVARLFVALEKEEK